MSIDPGTLVTAAGGTGGGVVMALLIYVIKAQSTLKDSLDDHKLKVAEQYVNKEAMHEMEARMDKRFDKLETLLNGRP